MCFIFGYFILTLLRVKKYAQCNSDREGLMQTILKLTGSKDGFPDVIPSIGVRLI